MKKAWNCKLVLFYPIFHYGKSNYAFLISAWAWWHCFGSLVPFKKEDPGKPRWLSLKVALLLGSDTNGITTTGKVFHLGLFWFNGFFLGGKDVRKLVVIWPLPGSKISSDLVKQYFVICFFQITKPNTYTVKRIISFRPMPPWWRSGWRLLRKRPKERPSKPWERGPRPNAGLPSNSFFFMFPFCTKSLSQDMVKIRKPWMCVCWNHTFFTPILDFEKSTE